MILGTQTFLCPQSHTTKPPGGNLCYTLVNRRRLTVKPSSVDWSPATSSLRLDG